MKITAEMLEASGACSDQVAVFRKHWPNGARPLLRTIKKAARLGLDLDWFARRFLTAPAWAAYLEATAPALAAYYEATATALYTAIREGGLK